VAAGQVPPGALRAVGQTILGLAGRRPERFAVDGTLAPGDCVAGFTVVATPGHTPGHLSFFRPADGVLIAGDAVRVSGLDILAPPFWDTQSEPLARVSIAALADLPVRLLIPGHGPPYRDPGAQLRLAGGPPGFMAERLARLEERRRRRAERRR
jgi:glyoxylase-like metal-dependent hydrolase (beta-lactamase superfamily II)